MQNSVSETQPETLILDASALVEALLGTALGVNVRESMRKYPLHAPAHIDAEVLSALGRMHRAGDVEEPAVAMAVEDLIEAPISRHPLAGLLQGAWARRKNQRLADALYIELTELLSPAGLLTTDARLARSYDRAHLITATL